MPKRGNIAYDQIKGAPDPPDPTAFLSGDGVWRLPAGGAGGSPYDIVASYIGRPTAGAKVLILTFTRTVTFAANLAGSRGSLDITPSSSAVYTVQKNGTAIGTVTISTGGVFTFATSGGAAQSFATGDRMTIIAPSPQDSSLSGVAITLVGMR